MKEKEFVTAIVLAAGRGTRMGTKIQKQYLDLCGKPVLYYSLHARDFVGDRRTGDRILQDGNRRKITVYESKKNITRRGGTLSLCLEWNPGSRK